MLILNGGGSGEQIKESYKLFSQKLNGGKVLYVPLAWNHGDYEDCLKWFKSEMEPFGVFDIEMVVSANQISKEKLKEVKGVFIGGGNTFKLLKSLKESCAFENLKEFASNDEKVIMGGSAGALIFGASIETCEDDGIKIKSFSDKNEVGLKDFSGFDLLDGFSLFVHYEKLEEQIEMTKQRVERLSEKGFKLVCLPEETSLVVDHDNCFFVGTKNAKIVTPTQNLIEKPSKLKKNIFLNGERKR